MRRKNNKLFLIIMLILLFFSVGYALISRNLVINGSAEVSKNTWDLHFDNINVKNGSVAASTVPTINNDLLTINFAINLDLPGDFYEFSVEVHNSGTIDAMIESISKTPELTDSQKKYLNYVVKYENGELISSKQLVNASSFVRIIVRVEYRDDLNESELPNITETLNLGFSINYVQADNSAISVKDDGVYNPLKIVSGDGTVKGDEICIGEECFYVVSSTDEKVVMLAKYNLYFENECSSTTYNHNECIANNPVAIQNEKAKGWNFDSNPVIGSIPFSDTAYWVSGTNSYPIDIYNENSYLFDYVENYKKYLENMGILIQEARLITFDELEMVGCHYDTCCYAPKWVTSTTYWTGTAYNDVHIYSVYITTNLVYSNSKYDNLLTGIRPVIVISKDLIKK